MCPAVHISIYHSYSREDMADTAASSYLPSREGHRLLSKRIPPRACSSAGHACTMTRSWSSRKRSRTFPGPKTSASCDLISVFLISTVVQEINVLKLTRLLRELEVTLFSRAYGLVTK